MVLAALEELRLSEALLMITNSIYLKLEVLGGVGNVQLAARFPTSVSELENESSH